MIEIQKHMLLEIKTLTGLSGLDICRIMGYGENSVDCWVNLRNAIPLVKMAETTRHFNLDFCEIYKHAEQRVILNEHNRSQKRIIQLG